MTGDVESVIRDVYPTGRLAEPSLEAFAKYQALDRARAIVDAIRTIPGVECERWTPNDENERALRIGIFTPTVTFWWNEFHGKSLEKQLDVIRKSGGLYCNLFLYVSNFGPFWYCGWTCFSEAAASEVAARPWVEAPTSFWGGVEAQLVSALESYGLRRLSEQELEEEVGWVESDREPFERHHEKVTVYTCLFDFL